MNWDLDQYLAFADERALPFHHLVAALERLHPRRVLDIGCGPGALTASLLERWPDAEFLGIDSSVEMIEHARHRAIVERLNFEHADVTEWTPDAPFDLVISNACLHWIEKHDNLLDHLATIVADRGTLAFHVPANHDRPSHTILAGLCASDRWRHLLGGAYRVHVQSPEWYLAEFDHRGFQSTAWQTTYLHRLEGEDPVLEWLKGTTLRPMLEHLDDEQAEAFLGEIGARLREAYPPRGSQTLFPFTRTFVVASRT